MALTRLPIGPILSSPETRELFRGAIEEAYALARCLKNDREHFGRVLPTQGEVHTAQSSTQTPRTSIMVTDPPYLVAIP